MTTSTAVASRARDTAAVNARSFVQVAGFACAVGGAIAATGAALGALIPSAVSDDRLSEPYTSGVFQVTEVAWTFTHVLLFVGTLGLARSGLAGSSRLARNSLKVALVTMAVMAPSELGFAFIPHAADESTASVVLGSCIGLAATIAGLAYVLVGVTTLRDGIWTGWGRWTPLLCGGFVLLVLLPVQALAPDAFLWPIAGRAVCFVLLGFAIFIAPAPADPDPPRHS